MNIFAIFQVLGGIASVVYGVHLSGVNLQKILGVYLERFLKKYSTKNRIEGVLIGTLITGLVHSRRVTSVMLVGFISNGIIAFSMAIPVMLGANIGSTVVIQLVSLKIGYYAFLLMFIGTAFHIAFNKKNITRLGEAIIGFSLFFIGLEFMLLGIEGLSSESLFLGFIDLISASPLLAILLSVLFVLLFQSSTAISILILALGISGSISLVPALFLILGLNLGSGVRMIYLSFKKKNYSEVLSLTDFIFNLIGVIFFVLFFDYFKQIIEFTSNDLGRQIANSYTLYNLINAIIFLPFVNLLARNIKSFFSKNELFKERSLVCLDRRMICTPSVSISRVNQAVVEMAHTAHDMLELSKQILNENKIENLESINQKENKIDDMTEKTSDYIIRISQQNLSRNDAMKVYSFMHVAADIEHLCDHIVFVSEIFVKAYKDNIIFSDKAKKEFMGVYGKLGIMQNLTVKALEKGDAKLANQIINHENKVDEIIKKINANHMLRVEAGECGAEAGNYFHEALKNLERIGDHYDNVAFAIIDRFKHDEREN